MVLELTYALLSLKERGIATFFAAFSSLSFFMTAQVILPVLNVHEQI